MSCVNDIASFLGLSCDYLFKKALVQLKSVINLAATHLVFCTFPDNTKLTMAELVDYDKTNFNCKD